MTPNPITPTILPHRADLEFWVPGEPKPWARTRGTGKQRYTDPNYRTWKNSIRAAFRLEAMSFEPHEGPVTMVVTAFRSTRRVVDVDNLAKAAMDALNGLAYSDDAQVFDLRAIKVLSGSKDEAGLRVRLWFLEGDGFDGVPSH